MVRGRRLELLIDDPRGVRDIPAAAEAEGASVVEVERQPDGATRITIER